MYVEFKENSKSNSLRETFLKPKIGLSNLGLHQFFCSRWPFYLKIYLKGNCYKKFEDKHSSYFSSLSCPNIKILLPNLNFNEIFCIKRLKHSKKREKKYLCIELEENRYGRFWNIHFRPEFRFALHRFRFLDFRENLEILLFHLSGTVYKIWCLYL